MVDGGYDEGYAMCPCFWGPELASLVKVILAKLPRTISFRVLDVGCGEGKNAVAFAGRGAEVLAIDCSERALHNARKAWPDSSVEWVRGDVRTHNLPLNAFDIVVAYGLLHCLSALSEVEAVVSRLQRATRVGGRHLVCAFNSRRQDLSAHPGFNPCLVSHEKFLALYGDWTIEHASDDESL
jgi:tellurite methyltransferase